MLGCFVIFKLKVLEIFKEYKIWEIFFKSVEDFYILIYFIYYKLIIYCVDMVFFI